MFPISVSWVYVRLLHSFLIQKKCKCCVFNKTKNNHTFRWSLTLLSFRIRFEKVSRDESLHFQHKFTSHKMITTNTKWNFVHYLSKCFRLTSHDEEKRGNNVFWLLFFFSCNIEVGWLVSIL